MRRRSSYTPPSTDSEEAKAAATLRLFGATDEAFMRITPEGLARDHRLSLRQAECMLNAARAKREALP